MRKKILLEQNAALFNEVQRLKGEIADLNKELEKITAETAAAEKVAEETVLEENTETFETPIKKLEDKIAKNAVSNDAESYGAKAIGEIVLAAAKACDAAKLQNAGDDRINLILGRAEVAKSQVLEAVSSEGTFDSKAIKIDKALEEARKYFA